MSAGAYILAGGRSERFGGDKARALLDGETLIVRLARRLRSADLPPKAVAARSGEYEDLGVPTIADRVPGMGPLGGLLAALEDAEEPGFVLVVACDLLHLKPAWLARLEEAARLPALAAAFRGDRWQPFPGLYHTSLRPVVARRLEGEDRSVHGLLDAVRAAAVPLPDDTTEIPQANTRAELSAYREENE